MEFIDFEIQQTKIFIFFPKHKCNIQYSALPFLILHSTLLIDQLPN